MCSFTLNYKNQQSLINYQCVNNHKGNISLKVHLLNFNKSLLKLKCAECQKNQRIFLLF